jgi:hypothetical protein
MWEAAVVGAGGEDILLLYMCVKASYFYKRVLILRYMCLMLIFMLLAEGGGRWRRICLEAFKPLMHEALSY